MWDSNLTLVDTVSFENLEEDTSFGCRNQACSIRGRLTAPTPGHSNQVAEFLPLLDSGFGLHDVCESPEMHARSNPVNNDIGALRSFLRYRFANSSGVQLGQECIDSRAVSVNPVTATFGMTTSTQGLVLCTAHVVAVQVDTAKVDFNLEHVDLSAALFLEFTVSSFGSRSDTSLPISISIEESSIVSHIWAAPGNISSRLKGSDHVLWNFPTT
eukprot:SAG31_NODE_14349_length_812_cov_0.938289_1_plen_213_part_01